MSEHLVGVLAIQGSFLEHLVALSHLPNVRPLPVKDAATLEQVERLIIPGGESTTMGKILMRTGLDTLLRQRIAAGMPVWGTCAGMILLAQKIIDEQPHLNLMDIVVRRNAYGNQLDSFTTTQLIPAVAAEPIPLVFIRAPWVEQVGPNVSVLAEHKGKIIAAQQEQMLVTSFHPELTTNLAFYQYFLQLGETTKDKEKRAV